MQLGGELRVIRGLGSVQSKSAQCIPLCSLGLLSLRTRDLSGLLCLQRWRLPEAQGRIIGNPLKLVLNHFSQVLTAQSCKLSFQVHLLLAMLKLDKSQTVLTQSIIRYLVLSTALRHAMRKLRVRRGAPIEKRNLLEPRGRSAEHKNRRLRKHLSQNLRGVVVSRFNRRRESLSSELRDATPRLLSGSESSTPPFQQPEDTNVLLRQSYKRTERSEPVQLVRGRKTAPWLLHSKLRVGPGRTQQVTVVFCGCGHRVTPHCWPFVLRVPSAFNLRMKEN